MVLVDWPKPMATATPLPRPAASASPPPSASMLELLVAIRLTLPASCEVTPSGSPTAAPTAPVPLQLVIEAVTVSLTVLTEKAPTVARAPLNPPSLGAQGGAAGHRHGVDRIGKVGAVWRRLRAG